MKGDFILKFKKALMAVVSAGVIAATCLISSASGLSGTTALAVDDCNDDWLHAEGSRLYDMEGNEVWLTGANWFGFNCSENCAHYLWSGDVDDLLSETADRGINVIRFPISSELLISWMNGTPNEVSSVSAGNTEYYYINPDFCNEDGSIKNSMEIFDIIIQKCKKYGIKAFVDVHSPDANNSGHDYNLWYGKATSDGTMVTTDLWIESLTWLAEKYSNDDTILGYDLKNEPHGKGTEGTAAAKWDGSTDENNWQYAATKCANSILSVNPNALIFVEGVEQSLKSDSYTWGQPDSLTDSPYIGAWWGGNLRGVREFPVVPDSGTSQIVYSPHDYGPSVYAQDWFNKDFTTQTLLDDYWYDTWAYINAEEIAPLLIGEWGGYMDGAENQLWMELLRDYMIENHINHTFWCLNTNSGDTGGLWKDVQFTNGTGTTIVWEEDKYALFEESLWQTLDTRKYISLDHQYALGLNGTGISLSEFYDSYAYTEGSNLDGGTILGSDTEKHPATTTDPAAEESVATETELVITETETETQPSTETSSETTEVSASFSSESEPSLVVTEESVPQPSDTETMEPVITETETEPVSPPVETTESSVVTDDIFYGDVNGDGTIDVSDVVLTVKIMMNEVDYTSEQYAAADCDCSGKVEQNDAIILMQFLTNIIPSLPLI